MSKNLSEPESNTEPYLSVGLDVGADFTFMSIALPNGTFVGKPFKITHANPESRELAVKKIKEAQEQFSLKSRCFLESTGIYHIPLMRFLSDKGFVCETINPIITKNSTNIGIRKVHNDKFDSKKIATIGLMSSVKTSITPSDEVVNLRNLVRDYFYFKDLQSAIIMKLTAELKVSFPQYKGIFSKITTKTSLKLLEKYPLAKNILEADKDNIVELIRSTARFGEKYAKTKYDALIAAAQDATIFGRSIDSNATRIQLYVRQITRKGRVISYSRIWSFLKSLISTADARKIGCRTIMGLNLTEILTQKRKPSLIVSRAKNLTKILTLTGASICRNQMTYYC